jgi:hypothetical protein
VQYEVVVVAPVLPATVQIVAKGKHSAQPPRGYAQLATQKGPSVPIMGSLMDSHPDSLEE